MQQPQYDFTKPVFEVLEVNPSYVYIRDAGVTEGLDVPTITNEPEWVLEQLHSMLNISGVKVFYKDTEGNIDELLHISGRFSGFSFGTGDIELT